MNPKQVAAICLIVSGLLAATILGIIESKKTDAIFEGKELFPTEEEYSQFKTVMGDKDIMLVSATVLSSSPPVVVKFRAIVPREKEDDFQYGTLIAHEMMWVLGCFGLVALPVAVAVMLLRT